MGKFTPDDLPEESLQELRHVRNLLRKFQALHQGGASPLQFQPHLSRRLR